MKREKSCAVSLTRITEMIQKDLCHLFAGKAKGKIGYVTSIPSLLSG